MDLILHKLRQSPRIIVFNDDFDDDLMILRELDAHFKTTGKDGKAQNIRPSASSANFSSVTSSKSFQRSKTLATITNH